MKGYISDNEEVIVKSSVCAVFWKSDSAIEIKGYEGKGSTDTHICVERTLVVCFVPIFICVYTGCYLAGKMYDVRKTSAVHMVD